MRNWVILFGLLAFLTLVRPASAQFSSAMASTFSGTTTTSTSSTNTSGLFSQVMAKPSFNNAMSKRAQLPTSNFLNRVPQAANPTSTLLGRFTTGTSPGAVMLQPGAPTRQVTPPPSKKGMFSLFNK